MNASGLLYNVDPEERLAFTLVEFCIPYKKQNGTFPEIAIFENQRRKKQLSTTHKS